MRWRRFGWGLLIAVWLAGCASTGGLTHEDVVIIGQREADLVARQGQPQEIKPGPGGGKIYVYTTYSLDQVAAMGGGAWNKPHQVYYWLNDQGVITKVARYPYGKRRFLFPSEEKPTQTAQAPAFREEVPTPQARPHAVKAPEPRAAPAQAPAVPPAPQPPARQATKAAPAPSVPPAPATPSPPAPRPAATATPSPPPPAAPAHRVAARAPERTSTVSAKSDMDAASRLDLNMSREEVRRILGPPGRTEGFQVQGRGVIVWFYSLTTSRGRRVDTPLVFEQGRLSGWGENYYRRRLGEVSGQQP